MSCRNSEAVAAELKGSTAFANGQYHEAIKHLSAAIELEPTNYNLYSDRSQAYACVNNFEHALTDAEKTIELNPSWVKGYLSKGEAYKHMGNIEGALDAFRKGLELEPTNRSLRQAFAEMEQVQQQREAQNTQNAQNNTTSMEVEPNNPQEVSSAAPVESMQTDEQAVSSNSSSSQTEETGARDANDWSGLSDAFEDSPEFESLLNQLSEPETSGQNRNSPMTSVSLAELPADLRNFIQMIQAQLSQTLGSNSNSWRLSRANQVHSNAHQNTSNSTEANASAAPTASDPSESGSSQVNNQEPQAESATDAIPDLVSNHPDIESDFEDYLFATSPPENAPIHSIADHSNEDASDESASPSPSSSEQPAPNGDNTATTAPANSASAPNANGASDRPHFTQLRFLIFYNPPSNSNSDAAPVDQAAQHSDEPMFLQQSGSNSQPQSENLSRPVVVNLIFNGIASDYNPLSLSDLLNRLFEMHEPRGPPPAAKKVVDKLPEVPMTARMQEQQVKCSVCCDEFELESPVLQLPCQHIYHKNCLAPWLKEHNTCPVCRYELPVDDEEYEKERKKRMAQRNIDENQFWSDEPATTDNSASQSQSQSQMESD